MQGVVAAFFVEEKSQWRFPVSKHFTTLKILLLQICGEGKKAPPKDFFCFSKSQKNPSNDLFLSGLPHPRVNLRHGVAPGKVPRVGETCTACAGTMILEFAALSRLSGEPVFEEKVRRGPSSKEGLFFRLVR